MAHLADQLLMVKVIRLGAVVRKIRQHMVCS